MRWVLILLMIAMPLRAGDYFEGYFYIVASIPSELQVVDPNDPASSAFRNRVNELSAEWTAKCGVNVDVWHTNLMDNPDRPWTPDFWFAFVSVEDTAALARANAPDTACLDGGYVKRGGMVIPTVYQMCAAPAEFGMPEDQEICK